MSPQMAELNRRAIVRDVEKRLGEMPDERIEAVTDLSAVGERMARMVPTPPGEFGKQIGPVYSTRALTELWSMTRAGVSKRAKEGRLLALKVEGENLFPLFQFDGAEVRRDVMELVQTLREAVDPFTIAQWLCTPQVDDDKKRTPVELLDEGEKEVALRAARRASNRWSA
ncbi:hypothetical protein [Nesterenkonia sp. AN1]|uniref:hypothetical protein n=1 Tax=Nesterenkonia sp. AN1 TaxID=652017 RepID=UPI001268E846|nr:hypothetical protein [Nesterenkonia sp. AN1]